MHTTHRVPDTPNALLLINADQSVLHLTTMMLEHEQFNIYHTTSGSEAERLYQEHHQGIALVICDANVLQHHDRRCLARMQEMRPDVQIILCASAEEMTHFEENLRYHDIVFIMKPYTSETVLDFVRRYITYRQQHP